MLNHIISEGTDPRQNVVLMHGILGSAKNWGGTIRRLQAAHPHCRFIAVDLRGHGESASVSGPHTVEACARDLNELLEDLQLKAQVVIGHSFGGKVALAYAQNHGAELDAVWTLDSPPGPGVTASGQSFMENLLRTLGEISMPASSRQVVVNQLLDAGFAKSIGFWMTTNLRRVDDGFDWRFRLEVIGALLADYWQCDYWPFLEDPNRGPEVHALLAGGSDWWQGAIHRRLTGAHRLQIHELPKAGHWVHIDDPDGLLHALATSLV